MATEPAASPRDRAGARTRRGSAPARRDGRGGVPDPVDAGAGPALGRDRRPTLLIFVKEPRPGRVKTRLARDLGAGPAARWFRRNALNVIRAARRDGRFRVVLAVSPDAEGRASRVWPRGLARLPQGRGDLGVRMARALAAAPPGPVLLIGADVPDALPPRLAETLRALGGRDLVFGPAEDGGFWAVGLGRRRRVAGLFAHVRWSDPRTLADVLSGLSHLRVGFGPRLRDVDRADDLRR